jgi:hypothetical protein
LDNKKVARFFMPLFTCDHQRHFFPIGPTDYVNHSLRLKQSALKKAAKVQPEETCTTHEMINLYSYNDLLAEEMIAKILY